MVLPSPHLTVNPSSLLQHQEPQENTKCRVGFVKYSKSVNVYTHVFINRSIDIYIALPVCCYFCVKNSNGSLRTKPYQCVSIHHFFLFININELSFLCPFRYKFTNNYILR